jgi:hypothetical protein
MNSEYPILMKAVVACYWVLMFAIMISHFGKPIAPSNNDYSI